MEIYIQIKVEFYVCTHEFLISICSTIRDFIVRIQNSAEGIA